MQTHVKSRPDPVPEPPVHPDTFNFGVLLNLVMMQIGLDRIRQGATGALDPDTAETFATRAYKIVVSRFALMDPSKRWETAFLKAESSVVSLVVLALVEPNANPQP